jgi:hypothetical protein
MGTPLPSYGPQKLIESRGIEGFPPRTPQTLGQRKPQNRDLCSRIWEENQRENNHEGYKHTSPKKSPREPPRNLSKKIAKKKGSENHKKGKMGRTQTSLEEPRRIIYTYHEGSYKV